MAESISYITCAIYVHLFAFFASLSILMVWCIFFKNPFPRFNFDVWVGAVFPECYSCPFIFLLLSLFLYMIKKLLYMKSQAGFIQNWRSGIAFSCLSNKKDWKFKKLFNSEISRRNYKTLFGQILVTQVDSREGFDFLRLLWSLTAWQYLKWFSNVILNFNCSVLETPVMLVKDFVDTFLIGYSSNT